MNASPALRWLTAASLLLTASSAYAIKTQYWTHTTADDFKKGTTTNVVVTNHGSLRLSRELKPLLPADEHITSINAMIETPDGAVVFVTFPEGKIIRLKDGKSETLATFTDEAVTALAADEQGTIYAAVAGEKAEIFKITKAGDKPQSVFTGEQISYIWSILPRGGKLIVAAGTPAQVLEIDAGKSTVLAKLAGENVLSLISGPDETLYAGTDTDGLVYRIDGKTRKATLLFDAGESEISALGFDPKGNLLVATGEAKDHLPQPPQAAVGRPEHGGTASTIPSKKPETPKQPDEPPAADPIPHEAPEAPGVADAAATEPAAKPVPAAGPIQPTPGANGATESIGNALYRVDANGFATELFRSPVIIYGMAVEEESILLATGESGEVYEIKPAAEETTILARTETAQVSGILKSRNGQVYLATSNAGGISVLSAESAKEGTFESEALDAGVASKFGKTQLRGQLPDGTEISISTRSGNAADPKTDTWSDWSAPAPAKEFLETGAPAGRYLQYRLTLKSGDAKKSPAVDEVTIAYQKPNVAPRVASITVTPDPTLPGNHTIVWEATDANEDTLSYTLYARAIGRGGWVELGKDLAISTFTWPGKQTADGRYEIKVVASDAADNQPGEGQQASRVSDTVSIDNTAPVIGDVKVEPAGDKATITLRVVDRNGVVATLDYAIDSAEHWQRRLPDDTIADSPEERYTVSLTGLAKGQHTLTVRATDGAGNTSFETIGVNVP